MISAKVIIYFTFTLLVSTKSLEVGTGFNYDLTTSVILGEGTQFPPRNVSIGDVGFQLTARLEVLPLWKDPTDFETILISIKATSLQLWIKSRKAPTPEGFIKHNSRLDDIPKDPIILLWKNGEIKQIFAAPTETLSSLNLKRGIASLFQYRTVNGAVVEKDASGTCNVTYNFFKPKSFEKVKEHCASNKSVHMNPILSAKLIRFHKMTYSLTEFFFPKAVIEDEKHEMSLITKPDAKTSVSVHRVLDLLPGAFKENVIKASIYTEVLNKYNSRYVEVEIEAQNEHAPCPETGCITLDNMINNNLNAIKESALGTIKSATAFLKIVPLIREASTESLVKILKSPRYHEIILQLYDLYGSASTIAAHQAAMKILRQDETGEKTERYLWALSTSPYPDPEIIKDVLRRSEETMQNEKVSETLALTAAAMAKRHSTPGVIEKVQNSLELGLRSCTGEDCKIKFLRSLANLGTKTVVPTLLEYATNSSKGISVIAWKALGSVDPIGITNDVKKIAMKTFLQLGGQKLDSSIRTLALNIILENDPSIDDLRELLVYLASQDPVYEVKKYLIQRIEQLINTDSNFDDKFKEATDKEYKKLVNYNVLAQRGLSTAFTRNFVSSAGSNGSLITIQEISSGLLKRGIVDVTLESGLHKYTFLSLGLFAGGLSNFVSSNENQDDNEISAESEVATAGMEIAFHDVHVRPFVFFSGQGELMGHVWSGTASERTSAFQTIVNLHRYHDMIPLGCGFVVEINLEGAMSVDLAGQIQLSLWSRNAQSLVEIGAGLAIQGSTKINTNFVHSRAEFSVTLEPKLELATDVDFSGPVSLCMRSMQPDTILKHHIYKVERIPGSRHKLRKTQIITLFSPARSYFLNEKNNEMCAKIFS